MAPKQNWPPNVKWLSNIREYVELLGNEWGKSPIEWLKSNLFQVSRNFVTLL